VSKLVTEKLAFKLNLAFMHGTDWSASNRHDLNANANATTGLLGSNNPAYDPVNSYGNESPNRRTLQLDGKNYVVARTGYFEKDVVDYTLQNIKGDVALQYALTEERQLRYTYRVAHLDNIYQRSNRFRLEDYILQQHGISYKSKSVQFLSYVNVENTGKSYNARSMAENIDRNFKSDDIWFSEYALAFARAIDNGSAAAEAHRLARSHSDAGRPSPGTREFDGLIQNLGNINNWDYGAALRVRSQMLHMEMVTNLSEKILPALKSDLGMDVQVGIDQRTYFIIPDGNYFINPEETGARISYGRSGGFIQANKLIWQRLRAGATLRLDKNDYYDLRLNPRLTLVYAAGRRHHLRGSYQNGYRFPSVFEAFSNVNSGGVKRVGGLKVMSEGIFENAYNRASIDAFQAAIVRDVNTMGITRNEAIIKNQNLLKKNDYSYVVPEKIRSFEGGYRGSFFDEDLQVDLDFYYNRYQNFIAQVEMNIPRTTIADSISFYLSERRKQDRYRMWTNSKTIAYNYGAGLGLKYAIATGYKVSGNVTYSKLQRRSNNDGLEDGFNTPEWILNVSIGNDNVFKEIGFNISCRWQSEYYWQSFLVNGWVDSFRTVDAQLSRTIKKITLKVGGTNVTNERYYSFLGGPSIGGFYYLMIQYRAD
jgi:outer membrane receptor protein involved in Fe transport